MQGLTVLATTVDEMRSQGLKRNLSKSLEHNITSRSPGQGAC